MTLKLTDAASKALRLLSNTELEYLLESYSHIFPNIYLRIKTEDRKAIISKLNNILESHHNYYVRRSLAISILRIAYKRNPAIIPSLLPVRILYQITQSQTIADPYVATIVKFLSHYDLLSSENINQIISKLREVGLKSKADLLECFFLKCPIIKFDLSAPYNFETNLMQRSWVRILSKPDFYETHVKFTIKELVLNVNYQVPKNLLPLIKSALSYTGIKRFQIIDNELILAYPLPRYVVLALKDPILIEFHGLILKFDKVTRRIKLEMKSSQGYITVKPLTAPNVKDKVKLPNSIVMKHRAENFDRNDILFFNKYFQKLLRQNLLTPQLRVFKHIQFIKPGDLIEIVGERGIGKTTATMAALLNKKTIYIYFDPEKKALKIKNPNVFLPGALKDPKIRRVFAARTLEELKSALENLSSDTLLVFDEIHYLYDWSPELAKDLTHFVLSLTHLPRIIIGDDSLEIKAFFKGFKEEYMMLENSMLRFWLPSGLSYPIVLSIVAGYYPDANPAWVRLITLALTNKNYREIIKLLPKLKNYTIGIDNNGIIKLVKMPNVKLPEIVLS
jgi:hypothetical protein